jgi:protein-L-isoaspartate O-methyltransferase
MPGNEKKLKTIKRFWRGDALVAVMTDLLELKPDDVVLEIGTGLGYQAALLAELAGRVYSVEIIDELAQQAIQRLKRQGYTNVEVRIGNGYAGWPEHAPFDKVIVAAAPDLIPPPMINQLMFHWTDSNRHCPFDNAIDLWLRPVGEIINNGIHECWLDA